MHRPVPVEPKQAPIRIVDAVRMMNGNVRLEAHIPPDKGLVAWTKIAVEIEPRALNNLASILE